MNPPKHVRRLAAQRRMQRYRKVRAWLNRSVSDAIRDLAGRPLTQVTGESLAEKIRAFLPKIGSGSYRALEIDAESRTLRATASVVIYSREQAINLHAAGLMSDASLTECLKAFEPISFEGTL